MKKINKMNQITKNLLSEIEEAQKILTDSRAIDAVPATFWDNVSKKNILQILECGYENFKQTLGLNYFTWVSPYESKQLKFLHAHLSFYTFVKSYIKAILSQKNLILAWRKAVRLNFLSYLVWEYALSQDRNGELKNLEEPAEGGALSLYSQGKKISQDLANSYLEYRSIIDHASGAKIIMELGGGYGRNAFIFLKKYPGTKYIMVDIPPAINVAQKYLSNLFSEKKVFKIRDFNSYGEIKEDFESSDICFLLPNQLCLLPDKICDLFINISSLHEMPQKQINYFFKEIERLTKSYFYFKQWKIAKIIFDNKKITETDYPVKQSWEKIFWRECPIQQAFFEALFKIK